MKNTKDLLNQQISQLAIDACRKMGKSEKRRFFKECSMMMSNKRYNEITGRKSEDGQLREVWEVDGRMFEFLWSKIKGYAYASAYESLTRHNELDYYTHDELDDLMSEIKKDIYRCLRYHGPTPNGCGFSKNIAVITSNALRGMWRERTGVRNRVVRKERKKGPYRKNFVDFPKVVRISDCEEVHSHSVDNHADMEKLDLMVNVPSNLKKAVELLLGNSSMTYAARECGLSKFQLEYRLKKIFSELQMDSK